MILFADEEQHAAAERSLERIRGVLGPVSTSIEPLARFWPAEEYHQDYHWKQWARTRPADGQSPPPGPGSPAFREWLDRDRFWSGVGGLLGR